MKSGRAMRIPKNIKVMSQNEHFIRSQNLEKEEEINPTDRWVLACIVKGLQGKGTTSKISLDKIASYCQYTDANGKSQKFGVQAVQASIDRLEAAGRIKTIKPTKRGQCTKYEVKLGNFEKINNEFFDLNLPPAAKGYILCALQHNNNKFKDDGQPNNIHTSTTYNISELSKQYNMPISSVYKIEKLLKDAGILTIQTDEDQRRDQETGLVIQNRSLDLAKVGLDVYFFEALANHERRLQEVESNMVSKEDVQKMMAKLERELTLKFTAKEVEFEKE